MCPVHCHVLLQWLVAYFSFLEKLENQNKPKKNIFFFVRRCRWGASVNEAIDRLFKGVYIGKIKHHDHMKEVAVLKL